MTKQKKRWLCTECGADFTKWSGQCGECQAWNTLKEFTPSPSPKTPNATGGYAGGEPEVAVLSDVTIQQAVRKTTFLDELDRVLGGGLVEGSVTLIGGDPGIGKSTLLLQAMCRISQQEKALYVTGEESLQQVALRGRRLRLPLDTLEVAIETCVERIIELAVARSPKVLVVDSIQTLFTEAHQSAPGGVTQIREATARLVRFAKEQGVSIFIVGHVTKEGALAGPRVLEHMVDAVLYFEGEADGRLRMIRAVKNRFGTVNELGVFAMTEQGLKPVSNPSSIFLSRGSKPIPGSLVMVTKEGSRPLLVEVQSLLDECAGSNPKRVTLGLDAGRLSMLLAVLHRHGGLHTHGMDVFINVVGGVKVLETASDLPVCLSIRSSLLDRPLPRDLVVFGEIGLSGELRPVPNGQERLKEAQKHGFRQAIIPAKNAPQAAIGNMKVIAVERLEQAIQAIQEVEEAVPA